MQRGLLFYVLVTESPIVLQLLSCEDEQLLVSRDSLLILNPCFHVFSCVRNFYVQSNCPARQGSHKDLEGLTTLSF